MDARRPIALTAVLENTSDLVNQVGLDAALRCSCLIAGLPVMEPAACHSQNRAQQADRIGGAMGGDEGELRFHLRPSGEKSRGFPQDLVLLLEPLVVAPQLLQFCRFHLAPASADPAACCSRRFTCVAATPSAWATLLSVSPVSSSRATAAALNSAVYRLRVFFVMTFLQMVFQFNIWSGLAGQGPIPFNTI